MFYSKQRFYTKVAWCLLACMIFETFIVPTAALALTNGPKQPEFDNFTPVAATNMVNTFTGGFSYNLPVLNIPGADGGGYALSLAYDANPNVEAQSSWVGNGWTLNPGALDRAKRGVPDDWRGKTIKEYNKNRPNWTLGVNTKVDFELASNDNAAAGLSLGATITYNNYTGFKESINAGINIGTKGTLSARANLGINLTGRDVTFSAGASFSLNLSKAKEARSDKEKADLDAAITKYNELSKEEKMGLQRSKKMGSPSLTAGFTTGGAYGVVGRLETSLAPIVTPYTGFSFNAGLKARTGPTTVGPQIGYGISFDIQGNKPKIEHQAYGYMYNQSSDQHGNHNEIIGNALKPIMSDYYIEKSAPYSIRDNVVGIPFNNADNFTATGEGLTGSFRLHHNKVGHFYPNLASSESVILGINTDLNFITGPFGAGSGAGIGTGLQRTVTKKWLGRFFGENFIDENGTEINDYEFDDTQKPFFRAASDLGGKMQYGNLNLPDVRLNAPQSSDFPGIQYFEPQMGTNINKSRTISGEYTKQSSHVEYLLNKDIPDDNAFRAMAFDKSESVRGLTALSRIGVSEDLDDGIAQIKAINPDGVQYIYGLPTYVKNERSLSYGVRGNNPRLEHNNLVYQEVQEAPLDNKIVIGQEMEGAYASTYLLTQINTYDYIDRTGDGATSDDFGGYTKFNYRKWKDEDATNNTSANNDLYHFRAPYTGLSYAQNKIADGRDDLGSVSEGYKEVYYMKAIETKSHIALFITNKTKASRDFTEYGISDAKFDGSGVDRLDGVGANNEYVPSSNGNKSFSKPAQDETAKGDGQELEKLERIVLLSKDDLSKPLVCTYLEYDYSTWPNLPNNKNGNYPAPNTDPNRNNGKLTLKKVWFEYEGVRPYKISPYEFGYQYKKQASIKEEVRNRYPPIFGTAGDWPNYSAGAECPDYSPHTLDGWGHHQFMGQEQSEKLRPWVWQGEQDETTYDPAAWQLKQIKLPSGGEILVQYEQKTYQKVQDRDALAMVSLLPIISQDDGLVQKNKFYLNLTELGITTNSLSDMALKESIRAKIQKDYVDKPKERIYFKFLYDLVGNNAVLDNGQSEYISGYAPVSEVGIDPTTQEVYVTLGKSSTTTGINNTIEELDVIPRKLCYDYKAYQYNFGALSAFNMTAFEESNLDGAETETDEATQKALAKDIISDLVPQLLNVGELPKLTLNSFAELGSSCKDFNEELSYIRIPMVTPKRGGGLRVKRILLYDEGLETGAAELYGTEYSYENINGTCSGVATNEPTAIREESALVDYEPRIVQTLAARLFAGKDRKELEAPFGESILPLPSIGYSRVVVQNIYKGETNSGHTEHEFYTCKDFPYDKKYPVLGDGVQYTKISGKENNKYKQKDWAYLPLGYVNYFRNSVWIAQGWRFIKNDMHGKPKAQRTYGGEYNLDNYPTISLGLGLGTKTVRPTASLETIHEYYEPGEQVDVMSYDLDDKEYRVSREYLGMEMDITMSMQAVKDETIDFNLEFDVGVMAPPSIEFTFAPTFTYSQQAYSSHLTSKVINFPAVAKSVTTTKNGTTTKTKYLAFSNLTGQPILTKVTDGQHDVYVPDATATIGKSKYDGSIYNWTIPAAWFYKELQQPDSDNSDKEFNMLNASVGSVTTYGEKGNVLDAISTSNSDIKANAPENVLSASAMTYKTGWLSDSGPAVEADYEVVTSGTEIAELNKIPRPHDTYIFEGSLTKDDIGGTEVGTNPNNRNYEKGVIQDFSMFDWSAPINRNVQNSQGWRWVSGVDKYSPNGYALEETNPLDIPSTAKYGYHKFLSTLVAQNAEYETVFFESFEDETAPIGTNSTLAHAGTKSFELGASEEYTITNLSITNKVDNPDRGGLQVKYWARKTASANPNNFLVSITGANNTAISATLVAEVGDWALYSAEFAPSLLAVGGITELKIINQATTTTYIDDVRVQPRYAEMMTYVYNPKDFKVVATFDDEHFGVYYQYNEEGQLTRKYIETERGVKLLQENQYNSHSTPRD